jgi:putative MATE family efflux protein
MHKKIEEFAKNPRKALWTLSLPMIVAMLVQSTYNIVDTAYVGRLGAEAIAALSFSFPIFFVLISINSGIAAGMGSRISRMLGAKKKKEAENTAMHGLFLSLILAVIIFFIGYFSMNFLFSLFGAEQNVINLATDYMGIILMGVFFMFPMYVFNNIFISQGDTKTPMKIQIISLITNIILDPIFIYTFKMGVKGAAIATDIAIVVGLIISLYYILKKSYLKIHMSSFKYSNEIIRDIFSVGFPATIMMLIISFYVIFINKFMAHYGTGYVAAFGIVSKLESIATMPFIAMSMAIVTLVGMFYGSKRYNLLKDIIWYGIRICLVSSTIIGIIFFIIPEPFIRIFTSDPVLIDLSIKYLRINILMWPLFAITNIISRAMHGMGNGLPGLLAQLVRIFVVAAPLGYLFVYVLKLNYLFVPTAMLIGSIVSSLMVFIWLEIELKRLNSGKYRKVKKEIIYLD